VDLILHYSWHSIIYIYHSLEGLHRLQKVYGSIPKVRKLQQYGRYMVYRTQSLCKERYRGRNLSEGPSQGKWGEGEARKSPLLHRAGIWREGEGTTEFWALDHPVQRDFQTK
jgi:hypothetical protein